MSDAITLPRPTGYTAQSARDVAGAGGARGYSDTLEISALRLYVYYAERGDMDTARAMLTRSLSEALMGNEGE